MSPSAAATVKHLRSAGKRPWQPDGFADPFVYSTLVQYSTYRTIVQYSEYDVEQQPRTDGMAFELEQETEDTKGEVSATETRESYDAHAAFTRYISFSNVSDCGLHTPDGRSLRQIEPLLRHRQAEGYFVHTVLPASKAVIWVALRLSTARQQRQTTPWQAQIRKSARSAGDGGRGEIFGLRSVDLELRVWNSNIHGFQPL
jgi:hypothetical protein